MRITSKYRKLNKHALQAKLKTASHRFALMVDNYSPDDTEAQNGLLMVTGKVFVPGYTDATVTIVYPKSKRSTDQSFYYITPTSSTEDMSLAYSDDMFYPRFSECEQAVKDLPENTVSQYFYDKGIIPDDPSTFTALTGIPLESSLVNDINEITGEDDAYYPPTDSNLQTLISQEILVASDPTVPYYYLANDPSPTVVEAITDSHIFTDPTNVAAQMIIILKRSDQHAEYNTSESTGDSHGWDLVITSSFAPDTIQTLSWDSFQSMDNDLQSNRFTDIIRRECRRYGAIYCSEISYQTWVEQYNNNFLTLASHKADLALDDNFEEAINNNDPWFIQYNDDGTLKYFVATFDALGLEHDGNLIFATKDGVEFCETLCDHIKNENKKPSSPLFTVDSLTLNKSNQTPIVACIYNDAETSSMSYLPLPSSLAATLETTQNFIQQLDSIQAAAHDIDSLVQSLSSGGEEKQESDGRPSFADSSWTQSSDTPSRWISPLYSAPNEPSCKYQIVWDASVEQQTVLTEDGEPAGYIAPYDILYHTLDGRTLNGFIEKTSYILGGVENSGDWDTLAEPMRQMLLYLNAIDRVNNSTPALPLDEQIQLLKNAPRPYLPDVYQDLPNYWELLTGSRKPNNLDPFILRDQKLEGRYIQLYEDKFTSIVWDPESTGYETPLTVRTDNESIAPLLVGLPWDIVFQSTDYSETPTTITQVALALENGTFNSMSAIIADNLIHLVNQTLELPNNETNSSWLDTQEHLMDSLSSFTKVNENEDNQLIYDYQFTEEQMSLTKENLLRSLKSVVLRLIFDGSRQELTPQLICISSYDDNLTVAIQNTQLTSTFADFIGGGILAGFLSEKDSFRLADKLSSEYPNPLNYFTEDQKQLQPLEKENALIELAKSLDSGDLIMWNILRANGLTTNNIFWYCSHYENDPYIGSTLSKNVESFAEKLQNNGIIPAPNSHTLVGNLKNKYYIPVVNTNKNMLTGYVELQFSAAKDSACAYVDDTSIHFMTGNTFISNEGGELVTFGDDTTAGFMVNRELRETSNLFDKFLEAVPLPVYLLEEVEEEYDKYCEDNQLYSQEYMDQYYSDGLLAHRVI